MMEGKYVILQFVYLVF